MHSPRSMPEGEFANHQVANRPSAEHVGLGVPPYEPNFPHAEDLTTANIQRHDEESSILGSLASSSCSDSNEGTSHRASIIASVTMLTLYLGVPGRRLRDRIKAVLGVRKKSIDSFGTVYSDNLAQLIDPRRSSRKLSCPSQTNLFLKWTNTKTAIPRLRLQQ